MNRRFVSTITAVLVLCLPTADAAWALRQVVPAEQKAGLEELGRSLRAGEKPRPDLPSVAGALYKYSDLFERYFGASGHAGRYAKAGWNDFLREVRKRDPADYSLLLHLQNPEGYLLHGDLLLHKPTGQAFLITGNPGSGKSLLAAMAVGSKTSGWKRADPKSVWEYLVYDQVLVLKSGGTLLAGLPPPDQPTSLITKFHLEGALPGYSDPSKSASDSPDFWKLPGISERRTFAPLAGLFWLNRERAKRQSRLWKDLLGSETITDSWSPAFTRRFHQLPVQELFITNPTTTRKFEQKLSRMARWAKKISSEIRRSGLEEVVLLEPGHPEYEAIFRSGSRAAEVVKGPLLAFLKRAQSANQRILIRLVPERLEQAQEWQKLGLQPLVSEPEVLSHARKSLIFPRNELAVVQVKEGDQMAGEYVELVFSAPLPLPGLAEPALRITKVRLVPSQTLTFAAAGIERFRDNRSAFLNQITQLQEQGKVALVGIPLGLRGHEEKGRFISRIQERTRTGVPLKNILLTEAEMVERNRREADGRRKEKIEILTRQLNEEMEQGRSWAETPAWLRSRLDEVLQAVLGNSVIAPFLDQTEIAAISRRIDALSPEAVLRSLDSGSAQPAGLLQSARARMQAEKRALLAAIEALPSRILEGEELTRAVRFLLEKYPFVPPVSSEGQSVARLRDVFLNREVRNKGWNPARAALLLEEVHRARDLLRDRLPRFPWFPFVWVTAGEKFASVPLDFVFVPGHPENGQLFFHLDYGKWDALQTLRMAPLLILKQVAEVLFFDDPVISKQTSKIVEADNLSATPLLSNFATRVTGLQNVMLGEGEDAFRMRIDLMHHGLTDHPWIEAPAWEAVSTGDRDLDLVLWQGGEPYFGSKWSFIDLVAVRVAQLLGGEERMTPLLLEYLDGTLGAIEERMAGYPSEPLSVFMERMAQQDSASVKRTLARKLLASEIERPNLLGRDNLKGRVERILEGNPALLQKLPGAEQVMRRWASNVGDLVALTSAKVILSVAPDPERSARVDRLEQMLLADLDAYTHEMGGEVPYPSVVWREVYPQMEKGYQRLYQAVRLRPAVGLESPAVLVGPDALARQGGLEDVRVLSVEELLERVRGAPPVVPAGRGHAVLIPKDGSAIPPQQGEIALYAHGSVMDSILQFLVGQRLTTGPVTQHEILRDDLDQTNFMVRQATDSVQSGKIVVIALRSGWTDGIQFPLDHAPVLLVDPETWPGVDQKVLAAYLARQDKLLGLLLDLSSGSIGTVRLDDGQGYHVLFASA